jgi:hypothetical protein
MASICSGCMYTPTQTAKKPTAHRVLTFFMM